MTKTTTIDTIEDYANSIVLKAGAIEDEVARVRDKMIELEQENAELRTRLESTEDALRREVRKGFKPVVCDCPHCGKPVKVKQPTTA